VKLLLCPECSTVFNLTYELKTCKCGKCMGKYLEDEYSRTHGIAEFAGDCFPIVFKNDSLVDALQNQPKDGRGVEFIAFIASDESILFRRNDNLKNELPTPPTENSKKVNSNKKRNKKIG